MKRAAEFFAGIGLVRMALEKCGWRVVFANDIDPKKCEIYKQNFGASHFILGDIKEIKGNGIPACELATASFPCIDLSLAGNRHGLRGRHSSVYWEFHRVLSEMRDRKPRYLFIENVLGLLNSHGGDDLRALVRSLNDLGYACDLLAVDAVYFLPQSRPRLFIIGYGDRTSAILDNKFLSNHPARPEAVAHFMRKNSDLYWFLNSLPALPARITHLGDLLQRVPRDSDLWWSEEKRKHLYSQMSLNHRRVLRTMLESEEPAYATVYKRVRPAGCRAELRFDGVAGCLRTPRGGSSKQFVIEAHRGSWQVRHMTAREYGRLQGVSDSFKIPANENQAIYGFGDAVCVPAIEWVVRNCISDSRLRYAAPPIPVECGRAARAAD